MNMEINAELAKLISKNYHEAYPKVRRNIKFPSDLKFYKGSNPNTLNLLMTTKNVTTNVQENKAAFEGWCFVIRRWTDYKNIILSWERPDNIRDCHYQRFLFRVIKMLELYDWIRLTDSVRDYLCDSLITEHGNYILNVPASEGRNTGASNKENELERQIVENPNNLVEASECGGKIYRQLPVGVFANKKSTNSMIFTGRKSAIDLWALNVDKETLSIFELKIEKNIGIGIISELFFYTTLMSELIKEGSNFKIIPPNRSFSGRGNKEEIGLIQNMKMINAYLLTFGTHPLIDNKMLEDLNTFKKDLPPPMKFGNILIGADKKFTRIYFPNK